MTTDHVRAVNIHYKIVFYFILSLYSRLSVWGSLEGCAMSREQCRIQRYNNFGFLRLF